MKENNKKYRLKRSLKETRFRFTMRTVINPQNFTSHLENQYFEVKYREFGISIKKIGGHPVDACKIDVKNL